MQHNILTTANLIWQRSTGLIGTTLITLLILIWKDIGIENLFTWLLWLHLPLLMFHEFEEYILPGGFQKFVNYHSVLSQHPPQDNSPISEPIIFIINIGVWIWIIIGALFSNNIPWIGMGAIIFQFGNIFGHLFLFQIKHSGYNPGMITAIFLFIPYVTILIWNIQIQGWLTLIEWVFSAILGILGTLFMVISPHIIKE